MALLLHGLAGGWDEVVVAVGAIGVLWLAVKLAGRGQPPTDEHSEEEDQEVQSDTTQADEDPVQPPPAIKRG